MTQKVNPSPQRPASSFKTAGAIAYGGGSQDGYIVPNNETTEIAIQDQDISTTRINQFTETSSSNSFDVSIDGGEAFVFGAWVCTDTTTTITLAQNTANQKVFIGWNKSASDNVIIGTESTFSITPGDTDQKIPLYSFDTDSNGVANVIDERQIGKSQNITAISAEEELVTPVYQDSTNAPDKEGNISFFDGSDGKSSGLYLYDGSSYTRVANSDEKIEDIVSSLVTSDSNLSWSYDNTNDTLTVSLSNSISVGTLEANTVRIDGDSVSEKLIDTRNSINQLFIDNARQDFELGLTIIDMDDGQFEIYADNSKISDSSNVTLNLGSPLNGKGTVSLTNSATTGFTEHDIEDYGLLPNSVVVTDDVDTNPSNGTVIYEIEDENGNIVTIPRSQLNQSVDISDTIETYAVSTRAVLERNSTTDTSPVLDAYSVYVSGQKPNDYLDAQVTSVSEV